MPVETNPLVPLALLRCGQTGKVGQIVGSPAEIHRLEELGLRAGRKVEMLQTGSPCIVRVDGQKLCFRDAGCFSVLIELGEPTP